MNDMGKDIYHYFVANFDRLPLDKQFHFASRLYVWNNDKLCFTLLQQLRPRFVLSGDPRASLRAIAGGNTIPLLPGNQDVLHLRAPFNARYPQLRSAARLLYWAAMLDQAYGIDARLAIPDILSEGDMKHMYDTLMTDDTAVAMLSTHAVNFLYLYQKYYLQHEGPDPLHISRVASDEAYYDMTDPAHVLLCIYMLTHAIIADSLFYAHTLLPERIPAHRQILLQLEAILESRLDVINLDNKLEFLVCCKLTGFASTLEAPILAEAAQSMSPAGSFLIDTHNNTKSVYTSFEKSEHRNALYIMTTKQRAGLQKLNR